MLDLLYDSIIDISFLRFPSSVSLSLCQPQHDTGAAANNREYAAFGSLQHLLVVGLRRHGQQPVAEDDQGDAGEEEQGFHWCGRFKIKLPIT